MILLNCLKCYYIDIIVLFFFFGFLYEIVNFVDLGLIYYFLLLNWCKKVYWIWFCYNKNVKLINKIYCCLWCWWWCFNWLWFGEVLYEFVIGSVFEFEFVWRLLVCGYFCNLGVLRWCFDCIYLVNDVVDEYYK